jgi:hypothetical protein
METVNQLRKRPASPMLDPKIGFRPADRAGLRASSTRALNCQEPRDVRGRGRRRC